MKRFFLITAVVVLMAVCLPEKTENGNDENVFQKETLRIVSEDGLSVKAELMVEIADTKKKRMRGLMYRTELADNAGMLFLFPKKQTISMWMANTPLSLDMIFINEQGKIQEIRENTIPFSRDEIRSQKKALSVLEVKGGFSKRLDIRSGDLVDHSFFKLEKPE